MEPWVYFQPSLKIPSLPTIISIIFVSIFSCCSFIFSCNTGIWHKHQLDTREKTDIDIVKGIIKSRLFDTEKRVDDIKRFYKDLNRVYLHLDKNNVQYKLIETAQAIDYLGEEGYQDTDKHYHKLENNEVKEELESFIQTLEIYKNHDMQSTI